MKYPFAPKSTSHLQPGQFWAVPLHDGGFGCGRVLQLGGEEIPTKSRAFFGGLLHWRGAAAPTSDAISGAALLAVGIMHIRAILQSGGEILGSRRLEDDGIVLPTLLSAGGGNGTMLLNGAAHVRLARRDEWGAFPVLSYWGFDFISTLAKSRLGSGAV